MEGSYRDWTTLPGKILSKIFHFAGIDGHLPDPHYRQGPYDAHCDLSQAALVCKTWKNPAQSVLYSHVKINSISQLREFHDVVRCNSYIGTMVLILHLCSTSRSYKAELLDIVTDLLSNYLPNLVSLYQNSYYHSYVPTLNALLESKLKNLKSIQLPEHLTDDDERVCYAVGAFLMKDRLQEVYITNDFSSFLDKSTSELAITKFQLLYDNLNQFNDLTTINITRKTDNGVQVLEHIVETCRSLRDVKITLSSMKNKNHDVQLIDSIYLDKMSHYIPRSNIKTLTGRLSMSLLQNSKILLYITKKYPNLEELNLNTKGFILQAAPYAVLQLLKHSLKIKKCSVSNLTMNQVDIYKIIGNFWNTTSKPGIEKVKFSYDYHHNNAEKIDFLIHKNPVQGTKYVLNCSLQLFNRQPHIDFIEKNGKFIGDLAFKFGGELCDTTENFLIHILTHCPKLRNLRIGNFKLHESLHSQCDETKKYSIDKFTLKECDILPGTLEQLSMVLSEVRQLRLVDTKCYNDDEEYNINKINMPQTRIKQIILGIVREDIPIYIKLFAATEQQYYYYQSDTDSNFLTTTKIGIQIDEKLYDEIDSEIFEKFFVSCQMKPEILFEYYTDETNCFHYSKLE